jgi:asparagine synthase (glutamine-hydrolysing)
MCGIAGLLDPALIGLEHELRTKATMMADAIAHRGPDGSGIWIDSAVDG